MDAVWPVSVKGVLVRHDQVLLLLNERNQWELPGGHVVAGESPPEALMREFQEETGWLVRPQGSLGADFFTPVAGGPSVLLVFYMVEARQRNGEVIISSEHTDLSWAPLNALPENLPSVYQKAIARAQSHLWGEVLHHLGARLGADQGRRMSRLHTELGVAPKLGVPQVGTVSLHAGPAAKSGIRQLHEEFLSGRRSPVEWVEERIARARAWQARTPIFIQIRAAEALAAARESEQRYRSGRPLSVMDGVLVGIKDLIDVSGQGTSAGSAVRSSDPAATDADLVVRLRQSGINMELGKLNLHEFAYGPTGDSSYFGATANPHNLSRMAGGSSSGSGAVVASGVAPVALGTDTGGSVRIPSAFTGISGLKPTYGRISLEGIVPLSWSLDHVGPMARTVADARELWRAMGGEIAACGAPSAPRVFWPDDVQTHCYDAGLQEYVEAAIATLLAGIGAKVERGPLFNLEPVRLAQSIIIGSEALAYHWETLDEAPERYQPDVSERLGKGGAHLAAEYIAAMRYRQAEAARWDAWLARFDTIILPTVPIVAPSLYTKTIRSPAGVEEDVRGVVTRLTAPFNFLGLPALSIPWGLYQGLPVGLQLVGRRGFDDLILAIGEEIQARFPESVPPIVALA